MLLFLNLSGVVDLGVLSDIYFTKVMYYSSATRRSTEFKWYLYRICIYNGSGSKYGCSKRKAAFPYSPDDTLGSIAPNYFDDHLELYFYGTRIAYGFLLSGLLFTFFAFLCQSFTLFSIKWLGTIAASLTTLAFVTHVIGLSIQMGFHARGRYVWTDDGEDATVGVAAFLLMSLGMVLLLGCAILTWYADISNKKRNSQQHLVYMEHLYGGQEEGYPYAPRDSSSNDDYHKESIRF